MDYGYSRTLGELFQADANQTILASTYLASSIRDTNEEKDSSVSSIARYIDVLRMSRQVREGTIWKKKNIVFEGCPLHLTQTRESVSV